MADFRKWLYAFAVVALLAGFTIPASAQVLMSCQGSANNPLIRAEEYTAQAGDIFITCTGGVPTVQGALIPKVNITVFVTNTNITSKITDTVNVPNFNEALLVVDEAGSVGSGNKLLNCGRAGTAAVVGPPAIAATAGAAYGTTPFTCDTAAPIGNGTGAYDGNDNHPNVFQGRQFDGSQGHAIQFIGVPIDPPGTNGLVIPTRTLRITNLRVNAAGLGVTPNSSNNFSFVTINSTVSFNGTNFGGNQIVNVQNGTVRLGLLVGSHAPLNDATDESSQSLATFLQCNATPGLTGNAITLTEGFPSAFRVRNWKQIQDNGIAPAIQGQDWRWNHGSMVWTPTDVNQNVPNALYNTESGLMYPPGVVNPVPGNPPPSTGPSGAWAGGADFNNNTGISQAGTASQGTRFAVRFTGIPRGSNPSVPVAIELHTGSYTADSDTGVMLLVCGTIDSAGAGGTPGGCTADGIAGTHKLSFDSTGVAFAVYEVVFSNPSALEFAVVDVSVNPDINLNLTPPVGGTPEVGNTCPTSAACQAVAGFAPFYSGDKVGYANVGLAQPMTSQLSSSGAPIPRFRDDINNVTPINIYSYSKCACDLLFPWVVGNSAVTTSVVVINTSLDPCAGVACSAQFTAQPQSGRVTFWFFGSNAFTSLPVTPANTGALISKQTTSVSVPAGSYVSFVISPSTALAGGQTAANGLGPILDAATNKVATDFAGYVIAQSEFQYCHGIAQIQANSNGAVISNYLALVLDKARTNIGGVQLRRTNQAFADELDQ